MGSDPTAEAAPPATEAGRAFLDALVPVPSHGHEAHCEDCLDTIEVERAVHAKSIRAIEAEAGALDAAWRRAEAALPEGWFNGPTLFGYDAQEGGRFYVAHVNHRRNHLSGEGDSPAAALTSLAEKLEAHRG